MQRRVTTGLSFQWLFLIKLYPETRTKEWQYRYTDTVHVQGDFVCSELDILK